MTLAKNAKTKLRRQQRLKNEYEKRARDKKKVGLHNRDLEKTFDSVWQNGLLLKQWTACIRGQFFKFTEQVFHLPRCQNKI